MKIRNILLGAIVMFTAAASMAEETYKEAWAKGLKEYKAKKYKEALVTLGEAAKLAKTPGEKYNSMSYQGYSLKNLRKYNKAVKVFEDLMKVEKLSVGQKNDAFSQYLHNIYWGKNYTELFAVADKTMADDKATTNMKTTCTYLACLASGNLGKYADKKKWAKKMFVLNPKGVWHSRGLIYQAQALRGQKRPEEALKLLNKDVIAEMHQHWQGEAYLERGYLRIVPSQKQYKDAVAEFTAVYELPKGHPTHKAKAIVYAIEKLNASGNPEAAAIWIERAGTIKNKYWNTCGLMRHAEILQKQGKLKEAKAKWEECKKGGSWWKKNADKQIAIINKKLEDK